MPSLPICAKKVLSAYKITELLVLENALLLPLPLKFNPTQLKHRGSLHKGTDALENDFGVFSLAVNGSSMWRRPPMSLKMKTVLTVMEQFNNTNSHLQSNFLLRLNFD